MYSHDPVAVSTRLVLLLQRLNVDVKVLNFFPDSANRCRGHVLRQLYIKNNQPKFIVKLLSSWIVL